MNHCVFWLKASVAHIKLPFSPTRVPTPPAMADWTKLTFQEKMCWTNQILSLDFGIATLRTRPFSSNEQS